MNENYKEKTFEEVIESYLIEKGGYCRGVMKAGVINHAPTGKNTFDRTRCLDPKILLSFIKETQPNEWGYLENLQKEKTEETILDDLCGALNSEHEGCLKVLRHGFKCFGKTFKIAYFAPASGLNPETKQLYKANRLTVTRQLHYSDKYEKSVDLVLSLNGLPLVTAELKNPMTGQTAQHAIHQYKNDRDPKDLFFQFKKRTLVHFAVDPDEVYMTTKLAGKSTVFLPFNKGRDKGAGNPDNPNGYKTAYLWEEIWQKDRFLDILARFIHLEIKEKKVDGKKIKKETMIFPRYHQLDVVRKLIEDSKEKGTGRNYLIEHSAGSGKSNSIAWLAHHLASLYNENDEKVFDSIMEDAIADSNIRQAAVANTMDNFGYVFLKALEGLFIERMDQNEEITAKFMNEKEFQRIVGESLMKQVYEQIRVEEVG